MAARKTSVTSAPPGQTPGGTVAPLDQVQVDWNEADTTNVRFIRNKPDRAGAFTEADETKLDGIEAGAQANVGEVFTAEDETKLDGIEAGAQANVGVPFTAEDKAKLDGVPSDVADAVTEEELQQVEASLRALALDNKDKLDSIQTGIVFTWTDATAEDDVAGYSFLVVAEGTTVDGGLFYEGTAREKLQSAGTYNLYISVPAGTQAILARIVSRATITTQFSSLNVSIAYPSDNTRYWRRIQNITDADSHKDYYALVDTDDDMLTSLTLTASNTRTVRLQTAEEQHTLTVEPSSIKQAGANDNDALLWSDDNGQYEPKPVITEYRPNATIARLAFLNVPDNLTNAQQRAVRNAIGAGQARGVQTTIIEELTQAEYTATDPKLNHLYYIPETS